ncbi:MAG: hypothetical protein GXP14_13400 [Gammaproteobacteria bacterium]|nr:hypothetical protein [Gammaproteobacteria bacterium]
MQFYPKNSISMRCKGIVLISTMIFLILISSISISTMELSILDTKITTQRTQASTLKQNTEQLTRIAVRLINNPGFSKKDIYNNGVLDPKQPAHWLIDSHDIAVLNGKYSIEYLGCFVTDPEPIKICDINVLAKSRIYQYRISTMSNLIPHQRIVQSIYTTTLRPNWEPAAYDINMGTALPQGAIVGWIDL